MLTNQTNAAAQRELFYKTNHAIMITIQLQICICQRFSWYGTLLPYHHIITARILELFQPRSKCHASTSAHIYQLNSSCVYYEFNCNNLHHTQQLNKKNKTKTKKQSQLNTSCYWEYLGYVTADLQEIRSRRSCQHSVFFIYAKCTMCCKYNQQQKERPRNWLKATLTHFMIILSQLLIVTNKYQQQKKYYKYWLAAVFYLHHITLQQLTVHLKEG